MMMSAGIVYNTGLGFLNCKRWNEEERRKGQKRPDGQRYCDVNVLVRFEKEDVEDSPVAH